MVKYKGNANSLRLGIDPAPPVKVVESRALTCHFCGDPVDRTRATIGHVDFSGSVKGTVVQSSRGSDTIKDVWKINTKVIACPKCCLRVDKVSFPYDEG